MAFNFTLKFDTGDSATAVLATAHAVEKVDKESKHAAESVKLFEGEVGKLSGSVGGLTMNLSSLASGGAFFTFDLAEGAMIAFEAVSKIVEKVIDLGKEMIRAAAGAETLNLALEYNVGKKGAAEFGDLADVYAKATGYDDDAFKKAWLPLFKAGLRDKDQIALLTTASLEVAARNDEGQEAVKQYTATLGKIALGGKIKEGALKEFGIAPKAFYAQIAAAHGATEDEARKMLKAGTLASSEVLSVIVSQIAKNSGNDQEIGRAALARGKTISATLQRLSDLPENIFKKLAGSEGMANLQGAIDNFIAGVEEEAPAALETFNRAFRDLFGDLSGPEGLEKIKVGIKAWLVEFEIAVPKIEKGAKSLLGVFLSIAGTIKDIAEAWPKISNILGGAWRGALVGGAAGSAVGGIGAIPGAAIGGLGGALAASAGVHFGAPEQSTESTGPSLWSRIANYEGRGLNPDGSPKYSASTTITVNAPININASDPEDHRRQAEQHAREMAVQIGQALSGHS